VEEKVRERQRQRETERETEKSFGDKGVGIYDCQLGCQWPRECIKFEVPFEVNGRQIRQIGGRSEDMLKKDRLYLQIL